MKYKKHFEEPMIIKINVYELGISPKHLKATDNKTNAPCQPIPSAKTTDQPHLIDLSSQESSWIQTPLSNRVIDDIWFNFQPVPSIFTSSTRFSTLNSFLRKALLFLAFQITDSCIPYYWNACESNHFDSTLENSSTLDKTSKVLKMLPLLMIQNWSDSNPTAYCISYSSEHLTLRVDETPTPLRYVPHHIGLNFDQGLLFRKGFHSLQFVLE